MTPLYIACDKNRTEIVRLLLDTNRVKVNQATEKHTTPLCIASWAGNLEIVRLLLLQPNIAIDVQDDFGDTAMSAATGKGHEEVVALLQVHARKIAVNVLLDQGNEMDIKENTHLNYHKDGQQK